jgi:hypothetical protein
MKFGAQWKQSVAELPESLREAAISYKAWKKRVKAGADPLPPEDFLGTLKDECERVNRRFLERVRAGVAPKRRRRRGGSGGGGGFCGGCGGGGFGSGGVAPDGADGAEGDAERDALAKTYAFAMLNRTCVYKLCKKYDKVLRRRAASPWFRGALGAGAYAFLNSAELKRLELELYGATEPCPVCLEETPSPAEPAAFILSCGHTMCVSCVRDLYGVRRTRGTLYNVLSYGRYHSPAVRCPMCRAPNPLGAISELNIYPAERAGVLMRLGAR